MTMSPSTLPAISRRRFLANAVTAAATCLVPQNLFAQSPEDFLTRARAANANNKITPSPLRRNVTALRGAGGNILVLTSKEGKLLVDSGLCLLPAPAHRGPRCHQR